MIVGFHYHYKMDMKLYQFSKMIEIHVNSVFMQNVDNKHMGVEKTIGTNKVLLCWIFDFKNYYAK